MKEHINVPEGHTVPPKARSLINRTIAHGERVNVVVLTCPDYASAGDVYIFSDGLGEGVPLLTKLHSDAIEATFQDVDPAQLTIEVLVADIESENMALVNLYTGGDYEEYKRRCDSSMLAIEAYLQTRFPDSETIASSFMRLSDEGGSFVDYRDRYLEMLMEQFATDYSFSNQVLNNVRNKQKSGYYQEEYGGQIDADAMVQQELITMAGYLTLGCILGKRASNGAGVQLLVSHASGNAHIFHKPYSYEPSRFGYDVNSQRLPTMLRDIPVVRSRDTKETRYNEGEK